jgi:PAS domain-containing protein
MAKTPGPEIRSEQSTPVGDPPAPTDDWMSELGTLLGELEDGTVASNHIQPVLSEATDNQLVQVRLGTAASLFAALQCKHAATAGHALRVALNCSAWALSMGLEASQRDAIEVAALLHDIGVIGVPDHILAKSAMLDRDEAAIVRRSRQNSLEILRQSCSSPEILEIVGHVSAWYDGTWEGFRLRGEEIPVGARMIAIAEAFDAMTTDQVYRGAMSQELAMTELFDCAGTQFDLELVRQFAEFHNGNQSGLHQEVAGRWLSSIDPGMVSCYWQLNCAPSPIRQLGVDSLFQAKLLESMYDAVVFIDAAGRVMLWNRGAERLTGITGSSVHQRQWHPNLLKMTDEKGQPLTQADCPVTCAIRSGVPSILTQSQ